MITISCRWFDWFDLMMMMTLKYFRIYKKKISVIGLISWIINDIKDNINDKILVLSTKLINLEAVYKIYIYFFLFQRIYAIKKVKFIYL